MANFCPLYPQQQSSGRKRPWMAALHPIADMIGDAELSPLCANNSHLHHRTLEHRDAGGGAVHSIRSRHGLGRMTRCFPFGM